MRKLDFLNALYVILMSVILASCAAREDRERSEAWTQRTGAQSSQWRKFEGAWFSIEYPDGFLTTPAASRDREVGIDGVYFESPDRGIRFYVVSPQWGKLDTNISLRSEEEIRLSQKTTRTQERDIVISRIRAKDGTYSREVEEYYEQDGQIYWAFEFRYANESSKAKYADMFARFKSSLTQFSD